jgi:hypothetical protein
MKSEIVLERQEVLRSLRGDLPRGGIVNPLKEAFLQQYQTKDVLEFNQQNFLNLMQY